MPEDSQKAHTHHDLEHISKVIRQKYPDATGQGSKHKHRWPIATLINQTTATILACIIFVVATPTAVLLLANDKPLSGLAALITALAAAFGPKLYAHFIQPRRPAPPSATTE